MRRDEVEISCWIAGWAERSPDRLAIRFGELRITFEAMEQRVARLAGALTDREEIAAGDRVAYLGQNAPELLDLRSPARAWAPSLVPLSARMPAPELEVVLRNTEPRALLAEAPFAQTAREAGANLDMNVIAFGDEHARRGLEALLDGAPERRCDPIARCGRRCR